jgi:WHG domain-containing protein
VGLRSCAGRVVLDGCRLGGSDAIDAIRMLAAAHGFTTLEAVGGFGLRQSADRTVTRLIVSSARPLPTGPGCRAIGMTAA